MTKFITTLTLALALAAPASAQQILARNQVGQNCQPYLTASPRTSGDVPVTFTNLSAVPQYVAWVNFQGNPQLFMQLQPGEQFTDISRPNHNYVTLDPSLNCTAYIRMGNTAQRLDIR